MIVMVMMFLMMLRMFCNWTRDGRSNRRKRKGSYKRERHTKHQNAFDRFLLLQMSGFARTSRRHRL
ncbi:MAG: hypothetical protein A3H69_05675 [Candidatus Sungbacteria bacterium RIFCSPLOWO2_02_FULL_47_9]|nr:MAG: hypothetical protein A3A28_01295 [Candidatus Sungbacteria bacterium RIFCSPLOWO2_01_FULL_47_32]OHA10121.1 MAG: hypothetical protein A3H69_05675 [Candidatus Sungbacteria bacterium RIFCSPLOWO2_02_FULL_47_9]